MRQSQAVFLWADVAGKELARHTAALEVNDGVLVVAVRSSVWAGQLGFMRSELLSGLNARLGERSVRDIRFRVGLPHARGGSPSALPAGRPELTREDEEAISAASSGVSDADLRNAWSRALRAAVRRSRRLGSG